MSDQTLESQDVITEMSGDNQSGNTDQHPSVYGGRRQWQYTSQVSHPVSGLCKRQRLWTLKSRMMIRQLTIVSVGCLERLVYVDWRKTVIGVRQQYAE